MKPTLATLLAPLSLLLIGLLPPTAKAADFQTGQAADGVVGKPDFATAVPSTPTATNLGHTTDTALDSVSGKLFIADFTNNRVLRYASAADAVAGLPAEGAFGQSDLVTGTANSGGLSATSLNSPFGIFIDAFGRLWVADRSNNRVLRYDNATDDPFSIATRTADGVLGQANFTSGTSSNTATGFNSPHDVWVEPNGSLWVCDSNNNRVVRFNGAAGLSNGGAASIVFGQVNFGLSGSGLSQSAMSTPFSVCVDAAGRLWIADLGSNRVLRFDNASDAGSNGLGANGVLGQANFTTATGGTSATKFNIPTSVGVAPNGRVFVAEEGNDRVTWFDHAADKPAVNAAADGALG